MEFIGRKEEITLLRNAYATERYEGIAVYGRRRIGKSELIKESFKGMDCPCLYYECVDASEQTNASFLSEKIAQSFGIPKPNFSTLRDALTYVFERSVNEKIILVLDEYPYLRKNDPRLDSILQSIIDEYKMRSRMKFILCGSYVAVMEDVLSEKNPLYGRLSLKLNVTQMDYFDAALFYPNLSNEDKVAMYAVFGGVPYYNQFVDDRLSVKDNIIRLVVSPNARLLSEARDFIAMEMNKMGNVNEAFVAIASGSRKFSDILNRSHVSSSPTLVDVLKKLEEMDAITKSKPINDGKEKKAIYEISDRLTLFYYRYIFRRNSFFATMSSEDFYEEFIEKDFHEHFVPKEFERIAAQYLIRQNRRRKLQPVLYKVGKYYYDDPVSKSNGELDVVALHREGYDFYEAKFQDRPLDDAVVHDEAYQLSKAKIPYHKLGFFSKSGFRLSHPEEYLLISLDQMYQKEEEE